MEVRQPRRSRQVRSGRPVGGHGRASRRPRRNRRLGRPLRSGRRAGARNVDVRHLPAALAGGPQDRRNAVLLLSEGRPSARRRRGRLETVHRTTWHLGLAAPASHPQGPLRLQKSVWMLSLLPTGLIQVDAQVLRGSS